jgi:hypothetical protein
MKNLLRLLGLGPAGGANGPNRRAATRYASKADAVFGWGEGDEGRAAPAVLLDVSEGGAAVLVGGEYPPTSGTARIRLAGISPESPWIEVEICNTRRVRRQVTAVHFRFLSGCSYRFFREAMSNAKMDGPAATFESAEFDTRLWR